MKPLYPYCHKAFSVFTAFGKHYFCVLFANLENNFPVFMRLSEHHISTFFLPTPNFLKMN